MADQAKGKGIAPKRASNPADLGQSSRPLPPIRTLLEDKEDSEDYSEVIEVLKQHIKSYKRVIASQSSNIKTLLLSLNTLKASIEDSISAIENISSTLASLTNSSNAATTGKTSYSPRFDNFSGTIDLDSPPRPPRKEPHLGPAVNSATSNLDPPIDTGSKEGFKDTITSSIVKELSKKAYTIPDNKNPDISNTYSNSDQAVLLMLLRNSLSSSPRAAISWIYIPSKAFKLLVRQYSRPIESKKEDVYNEFHALTFSTYKKGLSAFNAEFNGYLAKLTMAKIDIDPSSILNQQARMLGLIASSLNIEYLIADILEESRNPATEAYRAAHVANSSNSTPNSNSNPSKKGKNKKKGKKKASYNIKGQNYSAKSAEQASFMLGSYNLAVEEEEESNSSSNSSSSSDSNTQLAQLLALKGYKKRKDFKGKGLKTSSNKAKYKDNQPRRRPRDPALYNSWLYNTGSTDHISNSKERFTTFTPNTGQLRPINTGNGPVSPAGIGSITLEVLSRKAPPTYTKLVLDNGLYLPNIDINIVSGVRHYDSGGCLIKETLYRGDRRCIAVLDFKKSGFFLDVKGSSKPILHANFAFPLGLTSYNTTKSIEPQRNKIVVEIPSNSIRKEDYRPIIEDAIVSKAIEPNKRYKLRNSPAKGTTLEGVGPSLRGKRPRRPVEPLATAQAPYQSPCKTREPEPLTGTRDLPYMLREPVIEGNEVEKAISSPTLKEPNIGQRDYYNLLNLAKLWHVRLGHIGLRLLKKTSSITKGLPNFDKIKEADFHCSSCDRGKAVRRVSKALIPDPPRVLDSIEGDTVKIRPRPYNRNPIVLLLVNRKSRYRWVFNLPNKSGPIVANAIKGFFRGLRNVFGRYPTKFHFDGGTEITDLLTTWLAKRGIKFSTSAPYIHEQNGLVERSPTDNTALEGELVDLDLDLEGAVSLDPSNLNTKKPISIEIGPSKLEPYESSSDSELDEPLLDKPINPVIVESTRPTISIRKPELPEAFPQTIEPILAPKPIEVIAPNQPITNEPLDNSNLISKGDKMQLDYYKLLAKTSSYILSFVYKARKRVISKDSMPTTYKQVLKLPRDKRRVFKFLPRSLLPSNYKLITYRNVLKVKKDAKNRPIKYKSRLVARGFIQIEGLDYTITYASTSIPPTWYILLAIAASNKAIYKLLLKYSYNPSTPNIIKLSQALYSLKQSPREWQDKLKILLKSLGSLPLILDLGVFYNAKTYYFIVTYVDNCLFIGPDIGYITNLKKRLNKVYAIEDLGPAAYFLGWLSRSLNRPIKSHLNAAKNLFKYLNSTKDYSICFSYNGNTVANLGPKLSNSSNTTTKLSRDFHSKEGPRPLTTTSTTIVDSRNSKGSSRTSIINSSLVPIGFSDSDFTGDKATSKSTYGYLYKLAGRPISWKTKRATTIALSTLEAETDGLIEAIREVQWIIRLFSEFYRPIDYPITLYGDNQGSITVANNPALYARTKHTLLKFQYVREQVKAKIVTIIYLNTNLLSGF
ncbi:hypothetical protein P8C59_006252 [Phyllachora maydis]|uniref:Integrase catalytic domain-containing protein n=1 Tax=Phyllachora maydis TaxID=1825666 RepID=A0AAD9I7U7_9PEZI|nr:hypothetical protein P8C59_006252 [Phyllachora maydis]